MIESVDIRLRSLVQGTCIQIDTATEGLCPLHLSSLVLGMEDSSYI